MDRRIKVIIVAHEFSPSQGSECAVGWNIVMNLSRFHDLTVLYAKTNQFQTADYEQSVLNFFNENGLPEGLTLIPVPQPFSTRFFVRVNSIIKSKSSAIGFAPLYYIGYKWWQKAAYRIAADLISNCKFDLVHQLTSISFREPGYLWKLDLPFIWGPVSGMVRMPSSFYKDLKIGEFLFEIIRKMSNYLQSNFSIRVLTASSKASVIYPVTPDDLKYFKKRNKGLLRPLLDVGSYSADLDKYTVNLDRLSGDRLKLIWIGRLVYTKALELLLNALAATGPLSDRIELTVIGEGPLSARYKDLSKKLHLKNIFWLGNIQHDKIFHYLRTSDVLIHTSIKEATSAVILEALTLSVPVICHDAFGGSTAINAKCGIKIPLVSPNISIKGFRDALFFLINNPAELARFKEGARARSKELSWEKTAEIIAGDYNTVLVNNERKSR